MSKTASPPVIELRALKKRFGVGDAEHYALNGVDLTVEKGEFIAIMGPSGCGKTTLLNIIGLLDRATDGEYELDGKEVQSVSSAKQSEVRARHIGFVFQNFNLIERMNVLENVALPLTYNGVPHLKRLEMASAMLKKFHLQEREYYMPWQLSGGQSQRVAIARALVSNPSIILADEPTGNLDSKSSHIIMEELSDIHRQGNTIIMVTHNPDLTTYASRVITMIDGTIATDTNDMKPAKKSPASKRALGKPVKAAAKKSAKKPKKKVKKS
jgi:putative ABC transport system ATP-binding protein